jgi:hypothetical protein
MFVPKVVTANDLLEGDVVYLDPAGKWTRRHQDAELFVAETSASDALAFAKAQAGQIVGAYLADAVEGPDGKPRPVHFREVFRTKGPSNYPDHGKQAEL